MSPFGFLSFAARKHHFPKADYGAAFSSRYRQQQKSRLTLLSLS
jgi:hypothetical protein